MKTLSGAWISAWTLPKESSPDPEQNMLSIRSSAEEVSGWDGFKREANAPDTEAEVEFGVPRVALVHLLTRKMHRE